MVAIVATAAAASTGGQQINKRRKKEQRISSVFGGCDLWSVAQPKEVREINHSGDVCVFLCLARLIGRKEWNFEYICSMINAGCRLFIKNEHIFF